MKCLMKFCTAPPWERAFYPCRSRLGYDALVRTATSGAVARSTAQWYFLQRRGQRVIPLEGADAFIVSSGRPATGPVVGGPSWRALLERPDRGDHIALVYQDDGFLVGSVRRFIDSGL